MITSTSDELEENNYENNVEDLITAYVNLEKQDEESKKKNDNEINIQLPPVIEQNLADLTTPFHPENGDDIPFFFHVPLTAGVMIQSILAVCYDLVQASNFWATKEDFNEPLKIISSTTNNIKYVNINTENEQDIERARNFDLVNQNLVDVILSPQLILSSSIFTSKHQGRMFTLLRHPIERAAHMYHVKRQRYNHVSTMTLEQYANSMYMESDWLTRFLSGKKTGTLTNNDLLVA